jgi:hypothetical protein
MNRLAAMVADHFRFDKAPDPTDWAEKNLRIPREMSPRSHGPFSVASRPWQRELLAPWHPESGVRKCDVAAGVQIAKTTAMVIGACYRMRHSPVPMMFVYGMSAEAAKREVSKKRLHPIINANDCLRSLKPHDSNLFGYSEMMMAYGPVMVTGAGSDTNLAGSTQGIVAIDEAAKIQQENASEAPEAHPIRLAEDRTKDFIGQEFVWKSSTPNSPTHLFWTDVTRGTFTHLYVPCPHCREYFPFEFESRKGSEIGGVSVGGVVAQGAERGRHLERCDHPGDDPLHLPALRWGDPRRGQAADDAGLRDARSQSEGIELAPVVPDPVVLCAVEAVLGSGDGVRESRRSVLDRLAGVLQSRAGEALERH